MTSAIAVPMLLAFRLLTEEGAIAYHYTFPRVSAEFPIHVPCL
jgi:hypothetical protein